MKRTLAALAAALVLAACGGLDAGTVTEKTYQDSYTTTRYVAGGNGKPGRTVTDRHPECWRLHIEAVVDGETKTDERCVDEDEWNDIKVGDEWSKDGGS